MPSTPGEEPPRQATADRATPDVVQRATGRSMAEWTALLDAAGAAAWTHPRIVAHLEQAHPELESGWWRQNVTVQYEQVHGRQPGQTASGFQVSVQRTATATPDELWEVLVTCPGLWLGPGASLPLDEGARYEVPGTAGDAAHAPGRRLTGRRRGRR